MSDYVEPKNVIQYGTVVEHRTRVAISREL